MALQKTVKVGDSIYIRVAATWAHSHGIRKGSALNIRELKNGNLVLELPEHD